MSDHELVCLSDIENEEFRNEEEQGSRKHKSYSTAYKLQQSSMPKKIPSILPAKSTELTEKEIFTSTFRGGGGRLLEGERLIEGGLLLQEIR